MNNKYKTFFDDLDSYCLEFERFFEEEKFNETNSEEVNLFFIQITLKKIDAFRAVNALLQYKNIEEVYMSLGVILRSVILDSLISLTFLEFLTDEKNENPRELVTKKINELSTTQLSTWFNHLKRKVSGLTKEKREKNIGNFNESFIKYLNKPIDINNLKPDFKYASHFPKVFEYTKEGKYRELKEALFDSYLYYSQFEHSGILTHKLYLRIHEEKTKIKEEESVISILKKLLAVTHTLLDFYETENSRISSLEKIKNKIIIN